MRALALLGFAVGSLLVTVACGTVKDATPGDAGACPALAEPGKACSGPLHCEYGSETCCGQTHPSTVCDCTTGTFGCYATDACMGGDRGCPDGAPPQCTSDGQCSAPAICQVCPDGTTYSCATGVCNAGACEVVYPPCPAVDGGPPDAGGCPANVPSGAACSGSLHCEYGAETCCGHTYPSTVCDCMNGSYGCYVTDACLLPPGICDDAGAEGGAP